MSTKQKKSFPKIRKNFWKFLTDESGKMTKKDALWVSAGTMLFSFADTADANHISPNAVYHQNGVTTTPDPQFPTIQAGTYTENWEVQYSVANACTAAPINQTVNGHFSGANASWLDSWSIMHIQWHGSHGSHWSHWSHGSRW